jgi:hypothetical protein
MQTISALTPWIKIAAFALSTPLGLVAATGASATSASSIDDLKRGYVACEGAALSNRLDKGDVVQCSVIYEELKHRAFGGDFQRLRAWYQSEMPSTSASH